ncbi:ferric iron reductase protein FhuF [Ureibacillus xyleni]|uniref:Ferric iron reductase protein FhuF n=1 Tax=Ureibacillus xyleni TaxID=614648 RepID=A0A285T5Z9_9BACL|nr:(2Fe-2S)-binding protein [Ureibacillus xyleni]SOC16666.1 ferric iron reductase protein FhuF [Ureibacillus xyleni]
MINTFAPHEINVLENNYRLTFEKNCSYLSIQAIDLVNDEQLKMFLTSIKEKTKSANLGVAASLFVKRYSFGVLIVLYTMSVLNKRINYLMDNVSIQTLDENDKLWLPRINFNEMNLSSAPRGDRLNWVSEILKEIFSNHIDVLFNHLNKVTKLSKKIMWENLYTYIVWMYKNILQGTYCCNNTQNIKYDFEMIMMGKGELFGDYEESPFIKFHSSMECSSILEGTQFRKTCCLSYLTESKGLFCKNCPIKRKQKNKN